MRKALGIKEKNFLILTFCSTIIAMICSFFIYENAVKVLDQDSITYNMEKSAQVEKNLNQIIKQGEKLAAEIALLDDVKLFWNLKNPENADSGFYIKLKSYLKNLVYLTNDSTASIVLYAPEYHRIFDQDMNLPYYIAYDAGHGKYLQNTDWTEKLNFLEGRQSIISRQLRSVRGSYPYVLTIVKQVPIGNSWGAIAIDIDLKKIYGEIAESYESGTAFWVLDKDGRIIVRAEKQELFADPSSYNELQFFAKNQSELSCISQLDGHSLIYTQRYNREYELYIVAVSESDNYKTSLRSLRLKIIGIGILAILIASFLMLLYATIAYRPILKIMHVLQIMDEPDFEQTREPMEKELIYITDKILEYTQKNRKLNDELKQRMELLSQTKLDALKAQINPHFLFNTLNVIVMTIDEELDDSKSAQMVADLAGILQYSLDDSNMVTLRRELEHTKRYVNIMQARYKNFFAVSYDIEEEFMDIQIPKLLFQPFIENAVSHGFIKKEPPRKWEIILTGSHRTVLQKGMPEDILFLEVRDNGIGMSTEKIHEIQTAIAKENVSMKHIGIQNVAKRLNLLCPGKVNMEIKSTLGEGTCICISFTLDHHNK